VTVFLAEDNPILLKGLERALTANGHDVRTAADGGALLQLLNAGELPDILLLDVMMPGMTGLEVLDAVRANPRTAHLPALLITAAAEEVLPGTAVEERGVDVLMKPFRLNELLSRLEAGVAASREGSGSRSVSTKPVAAG
jgi:CheY-like chemotaxis protein